MPSLISIDDASGVRLYANTAARRWVGSPTSFISERAGFRFLREDGSPLAPSDLPARLAAQGLPQRDVVFGIVSPDAPTRWFRGDSVPVVGPNGEIEGIVNCVTDITDWRAAELARRESEAKYRRIIETANEGIVTVDLQGLVTYVSPRFCAMVGRAENALLGVSLQALVSPSAAGMFQLPGAEDPSGRLSEYTVPMQHSAGHDIWLRVSAAPLIAGDGRVTGWIAMVTDITESRRSEARADMVANRLERLVEATPDAIVATDLDGRCVIWNGGAERLLGWAKAEVVGRPFGLTIPSERMEEAKGQRQRAIDLGETQTYESVRVTKDGRRVAILGTVSPFFDEHGRVEGVTAIYKDISAQKALEENSRKLAVLEERSRLGREIHDSSAQLLGYAHTKAQAIQELLRRGDVEKAMTSLEQLIDASRQAYADLREEVFALRTVRADGGLEENLREYLERWTHMSSVPATLTIGRGANHLRLDQTVEVQVMRIVQEALTNVRKHAGANRVEVIMRRRQGTVEIVVRDDGQGLRKWEQGRRSTDHFGLAIMRERAESVGGRSANPQAAGRGTTVTLSVPS